jgi:septal ring factor EnvC (AmiA/AmiB activator)
VLSGGSAELTVGYVLPDDVDLEQRVALTERNVTRMREDLNAYQKKAEDQLREHKEEMKRDRDERETADNAIHEKIKEAETGGLHLDWSGVWWLLSGTICSTFPKERAAAAVWTRT